MTELELQRAEREKAQQEARKLSPDDLADKLRRIATEIPAHRDTLNLAASLIVKQACRLTLVKRAMM